MISLTKQCKETIERFKFNKKLLDSGKSVEISHPSNLRCGAAFPSGLPFNVHKLKQIHLDGEFCDVGIYIEGHGLVARAHKIVLSLWSIPFTKVCLFPISFCMILS